jgi:pimeloyl-ACP methyl ester carboxylesterase
MHRIESLLSARMFLVPEKAGKYIYFVSNLSGRLSLYRMKKGGSVPEPLLPPDIALQNPHLIGNLYKPFPKLGKLLVMIDRDGNEDYKPMLVPMTGGYPEPAFSDLFESHRFFLGKTFPEKNIAYFNAASHSEAKNTALRVNLGTGEVTALHESVFGSQVDGVNADHSKLVLVEGYSAGDTVFYLWENGEVRTLYGTPLTERDPEGEYPLTGMFNAHFVRGERGLLVFTTLFEDTGGLAYFDLDNPANLRQVPILGAVHQGIGEFEGLEHMEGNRFLAGFNIDGVDWVYEGHFDEAALEFHLDRVLAGQGKLANGVVEHFSWERKSGEFAASHSTATSPTQIYRLKPKKKRIKVKQLTRERVLGIPQETLAPGEDASFTSFDGLRVSARLYLPAESLGFKGPRPLVYYVHGGPQGQERPDFAWFSMPLIQFLALNGFAVFVPNVRGSTGYGLAYMKKVDRDWGGDDRLDHVHAMTKVLPHDPRVDVSRAAVVGRSYGGYMTLTLAARHPGLWKAACDMFGPYDLLSFSGRIPETWKPYFKVALGDPENPEERKFLVERSPRTYIENITAPLLVVQGKNDPRVVEQESRDLVEYLRSQGKEVEYLMFEDEGHDVLKFENRVTVYNAITDFFKKHLMTG